LRQTVCSTLSRSGWSTVRSALLAKGGTSKKRLSLHLPNVLTQSNKASPWTLQTALIDRYVTIWHIYNTIHGLPLNDACSIKQWKCWEQNPYQYSCSF
jgi:hypothetical protein